MAPNDYQTLMARKRRVEALTRQLADARSQYRGSLRAFYVSSGMSTRALGRLLGLTAARISQIINGEV